MEKEVKITSKMKVVINAIREMGGKGFAREVLNFLDTNNAERTDLRTFNAVNATLAYVKKAGLLNSAKEVYGEGEDAKMLTVYSVNENTPSFDEEDEEEKDIVEDAE